MIRRFFLFFGLCNFGFSYADKIPLYILYTPSHERLFKDWFLPSIKDEFELRIKKIDQTCPSATFKKSGWKDTTIQKVQMIIDAIKETWGAYFIYSDVDIQFFGSIQDDLMKHFEGYDLVIQRDDPTGKICSGFFVCRSNERTLALWQDVFAIMKEFKKYSDQGALNYCLRKKNNPYNVTWNYLPETYFGGGTYAGEGWYPGKQMYVPIDAKMHHANWTAGVYNKYMQLWYVKERVLLLHATKTIKGNWQKSCYA